MDDTFGLQAAGTSAAVTVSGVVPVVLRVSATQRHNLSYIVHEESNNRDGYQVLIDTDSKTAKYNGKAVEILNGQGVLTHIFSQDESVDAFKVLELSPQATYFSLTIHSN